MIRSFAYIIVLVFIVAGCSKNDNPAGPSGGSATQQFIFVNPLTGNDGSSGTQDAPVKTIHRALALFKPGIRIELQAGTYNAANGQVFPDSLPSGVVIESVSAGQAVLVGTIGDLAFYAAGTDTLKYVQFQGFNTCIRAGSGSHVLLGVGLTTINKTFDIYGAAEGIFQDGTGTSAVIATAKEFSRITIKNCVLSGGTSNLALVTLSNAARAADYRYNDQGLPHDGPGDWRRHGSRGQHVHVFEHRASWVWIQCSRLSPGNRESYDRRFNNIGHVRFGHHHGEPDSRTHLEAGSTHKKRYERRWRGGSVSLRLGITRQLCHHKQR